MKAVGRYLYAHKRSLTAVVLVAVSFAWVLVAQKRQGIVRDEVVYMAHGAKYASWWSKYLSGAAGLSTEEQITAHFGGRAPTANNREHPPLMKTLFGFSKLLFHDKLGWASELTAYRLPTAAMNAILVLLVFLLVLSIWGYSEAVLSALLTLLLPRAFFHAGLACFDAAVVTMWIATIYAYYRALTSRWWCLGVGVAFGLALATKHNAILIPVVLVVHYLWVAAYAYADDMKGRGATVVVRAFLRGLIHTRPLVFGALISVGPLVFIALWPWLWFDTIPHVREWLNFHFSHVHYNFEYLGENWNGPPYPWHVPIVTTLFTVPVATLVAAALGAGTLVVRAWRREAMHANTAPALLLLLSAGVAMGPFILTTVPIFGAEKHWAAAIPTICIFGAIGIVHAARCGVARLEHLKWLRGRDSRHLQIAAITIVGGVCVGAATAETLAAQPYGLSHYNALAGGAPGGADLGMNRQFWGYAALGTAPAINKLADDRSVRVYTHDASMSWPYYMKYGIIRPNARDSGHEAAGIARSDVALVVHEKHFNRHDYMIWKAYGSVQPGHVLTVDGVPIVSVYVRGSPDRK